MRTPEFTSFLRCESTPSALAIQGASEGFELLAAEPGDGDAAGKPRRFKLVAYTGGAMRPAGFGATVVVDLAGVSVPRQDVPILRQHDPERIVGHTTAVEVTAKQIEAAGLISGTGDAATEVVALAANGFPWQASIGAAIGRLEYVERDQQVKVNGRSFTGPLYVVRACTLGEVSFVPMGADGATSATVSAQHQGAPMTFEQWLAAKGFGVADLNDAQRAFMQASFDAEQKPKDPTPAPVPKPADPAAEMRAAAAAEATRIASVQRVSAQFGSPTVEVEQNGVKARVGLTAHAIEAGWDAGRTELEARRQTRPTVQAAGGPFGARADNQFRVLAAAVAQAGRLPNVERHYDAQTLEAAHSRYRGRIGLHTVLLEAAYANGYSGLPDVKANADAVLRAAFSTLDLGQLLVGVTNKYLMAGFMGVEQTWRRLVSTRPVNDFKAVTGYRLNADLEFKPVGPAGEIEHGTASTDTYTNKVDTFAKMLGLTRQDIINDDLGALSDLPKRIGRGGALALVRLVWRTFLNNAAFFTAGRKNYFEGAGSALSAASLAAAVKLFRQLEDPNGDPVAVEPKFLVVPPELETVALELYTSTNFNTGGAATGDKVANRNIFANRYEPVVSAYLSNAKIPGASGTGWYLLADPADMPTVEVAFLNGVEQPTVETAEADFNKLGVQMRGYFDFGAAFAEYRGGVKSKGSA